MKMELHTISASSQQLQRLCTMTIKRIENIIIFNLVEHLAIVTLSFSSF